LKRTELTKNILYLILLSKMMFQKEIIEHWLAMLHHFNLSKSFWRELLIITNYFQNKSPTKTLANHKTFIEIWFGIKPIIFYLRAFDCKNFSFVHKENRQKLHTHRQ